MGQKFCSLLKWLGNGLPPKRARPRTWSRSLSYATDASVCGITILARKSQNPPFGPLVSAVSMSEWAYSGWLECGDSSCKAHVPIFARLNPAVSPGARQRESMDWIWDGVHCPSGHAIPKPVLRLEPPCSLDCPSCGATSWEEPRDWFQDEKRIECVFCGKFLTLTAEHISSLRCGHA